MWEQPWRQADRLRRSFGGMLDIAGFGPREQPWTEVAASAAARLRRYDAVAAAQGPTVLIVPAPIKRPYIWDLCPEASPVRRLLEARCRVYLLEWREDGAAEIGAFATRLLDWAVRIVERDAGHSVALAGHSLGGTLSAIYAAWRPRRVAALVLVEAPLAFGGGSGALALGDKTRADASLGDWQDSVPGSVLSLQGLLAAPEEFVVQRQLDALTTIGDARALALRRRVTRWLLDEFPIPARLYREAVEQLLREDRFARGLLRIDGKLARPASILAPVLVIADPQSRLAPLSASQPVLAAGRRRCKVLRYDAERGIGCRHVGALVGPSAQTVIWPKVAAWLAEM